MIERGTNIDDVVAQQIIEQLLEEESKSLGIVKNDSVIRFLKEWFS